VGDDVLMAREHVFVEQYLWTVNGTQGR